MACCTTISPLNSSQKRRTSALFDFPHSAKRRRPLSSSNLTSSMLTTTTNVLNSNKKSLPYSPMSVMASDDSDEKQTKNELMERIRHEAKRLIRRRQMGVSSFNMLNFETSASDSSLSNEPVSPVDSTTDSKNTTVKSLLSHNDVPLFSMNQVNFLCDKMIREREQFIREQYDKILTEKLSEQYDAFVKFTHEQIQRRFETSQCSYVS